MDKHFLKASLQLVCNLLVTKFVCPQANSCRFCLFYDYHELENRKHSIAY